MLRWCKKKKIQIKYLLLLVHFLFVDQFRLVENKKCTFIIFPVHVYTICLFLGGDRWTFCTFFLFLILIFEIWKNNQI